MNDFKVSNRLGTLAKYQWFSMQYYNSYGSRALFVVVLFLAQFHAAEVVYARFSCNSLFFGSHKSYVFVAEKYSEPPQFRQRFIRAEDKAEFELMAKELPDEEIPDAAFDYYVKKRLEPFGRIKKGRILNILNSRIDEADGEYTTIAAMTVGGSRDLIDRFMARILGASANLGVFYNPVWRNRAIYFSVLAHELTHIIQLLMPSLYGDIKFDNQAVYQAEFGAVLAEWEYWQLIPEHLRQEEEQLALKTAEPTNNFLNRFIYAHDQFAVFHSHTGYGSPEKVKSQYENN